MAIGTNATIELFGTQDQLDTSSASVADAAFSIASDTSEWVNDDDAPLASVVGKFTFATAPTAGTTIDLYLQKLNVQSTDDDDFPNADIPRTYVGSFTLDNVTTEQIQTIEIKLPNYKTSSVFVAAIQNNGGQTLSAGWELWITPKTYGPHA